VCLHYRYVALPEKFSKPSRLSQGINVVKASQGISRNAFSEETVNVRPQNAGRLQAGKVQIIATGFLQRAYQLDCLAFGAALIKTSNQVQNSLL